MRSSWAACAWSFILIVLAKSTFCKLYTDAVKLPRTSYDFVVVGAGTAGNVVAARLSQNPKFSVLVIEAGVSDKGVLNAEVPFLAPRSVPTSPISWNYTTIPQRALDNRTIALTRGRLLGGSSSINFLAWTRGSNEEYDRWANLTGDDGWAWKNLTPYYFRSSRLVPSADMHNTTGQVDPAAHGFGPLEVSLPGFPTELDNRVLATSHLHIPEFPLNLDINAGNGVGVGLTQSTIGMGARSSSATAYLEPALNRRNLDVLIQNTVTRIISSTHEGGHPVFSAVEFSSAPEGKRHTVTAKKEVILSAGSIGTAQILLLSGIGNKTTLAQVGIDSTVDLPDVGQHLQDHPILANYWTVSSNTTTDIVQRDPAVFNSDLALWQKNRTGLFTDSIAIALAFLRISGDDDIWKNFSDPSAGPNSAHFELLFADGYSPSPVPATGGYLTVNSAIVSPVSEGSVTLASADPFAFPLIDPGFFTSPFDELAMLRAIKSTRRFIETSPWAGFALERYGPVGTAETDDDILAAARGAARSIYHPVGTARMSPKDAPWGVTDPHLRVKGTRGLRVVDASVFPKIPAAHTQAPVYIVAERAVDLIKDSWL